MTKDQVLCKYIMENVDVSPFVKEGLCNDDYFKECLASTLEFQKYYLKIAIKACIKTLFRKE